MEWMQMRRLSCETRQAARPVSFALAKLFRPRDFGAPRVGVVLMADVDSLLSELDGLLKDSPPGQRPPQRPSAAPAAPRLAPGRPDVEDDIESLLSSLGGAEAFSSNAASRATCAPRATCPPALAPSSSSAPPDGASCETTYVPRYTVSMHAHVPQRTTHPVPPPWQLAVQQVRLQGDAFRRPEVERLCRLHVLPQLHG